MIYTMQLNTQMFIDHFADDTNLLINESFKKTQKALGSRTGISHREELHARHGTVD